MMDIVDSINRYLSGDKTVPKSVKSRLTKARDEIVLLREELEDTKLVAVDNANWFDALKVDYDKLRAELEVLKRDAKRYQWLRSTTNAFTNSAGERINVKLHPEQWDAAIDEAMRGEE